MFARYSRTTKSLRRLFLDEFADDIGDTGPRRHHGRQRTRRPPVRERVRGVRRRLGGPARRRAPCVRAVLAAAREGPRVGAPRRLPRAVDAVHALRRPARRARGARRSRRSSRTPRLAERYAAFLDEVFTTYGRMYEPMEAYFKERFPKQDGDSDFVYRQTILAKTCDTLRVLLPAGTRSNLGIYATGQSYEQLLMRLAVHPLAEMREYGELMKIELRKVIPEFLKRVDVEERGRRVVALLAGQPRARRGAHAPGARRRRKPESPRRGHARRLRSGRRAEGRRRGAVRLLGAARRPAARARPRDDVPTEREDILRASVGDRTNRRHKPGRSWERTELPIRRAVRLRRAPRPAAPPPLTIEWQRLTTEHGYETPPQIDEAGLRADWDRVMEASAEMEGALLDAGSARRRRSTPSRWPTASGS